MRRHVMSGKGSQNLVATSPHLMSTRVISSLTHPNVGRIEGIPKCTVHEWDKICWILLLVYTEKKGEKANESNEPFRMMGAW